MMLRLFALALATVTLSGCFISDDKTPDIYRDLLGKALPPVDVKTLDEEDVLFAITGEGKPAIVNIWATWCPPCIKELPGIHELHQSGEIEVVTIAVDRDATPIRAYLREQGMLNLPVLWDSLGVETRKNWNVQQLPLTYVIDESGTLRAIEAGEREWNHPSMINKVKRLTKVDRPATATTAAE